MLDMYCLYLKKVSCSFSAAWQSWSLAVTVDPVLCVAGFRRVCPYRCDPKSDGY